MLKQLILLLGTLCLFTACEVEKPQPTILADNLNGTLRIQYKGPGDIVTCRLFDRVATMEKIDEAHFQLSVQVENLDSSVFGFYINSYKLNNDNKSELIESYTHKWRGSILLRSYPTFFIPIETKRNRGIFVLIPLFSCRLKRSGTEVSSFSY